MIDYQKCKRVLDASDGFTVDPRTGEFAPAEGYMVGIKGHEARVPLWLAEQCWQALLSGYVASMQPYLKRNENWYVGCWVFEEEVYFDLSVWTPGPLRQALQFAKGQEQLSVYDLKAGVALFLEDYHDL